VIALIVIAVLLLILIIANLILCICFKRGLFQVIKDKCCPDYERMEDDKENKVEYGALQKE